MKKKVSSLCQQIGENIRYLREQLNISQEELADRADVHRAYIGQVERAERNLTINSLQKIANGLQIDVLSLLLVGKNYENALHKHKKI
jgi:transcriptional regulator with XRE-family HTH domain